MTQLNEEQTQTLIQALKKIATFSVTPNSTDPSELMRLASSALGAMREIAQQAINQAEGK